MIGIQHRLRGAGNSQIKVRPRSFRRNGVPLWHDLVILYEQKGLAINIIDPRSYGIDLYGDNLFTTEREIREHPERVEKVRRATFRGWAYALKNKE